MGHVMPYQWANYLGIVSPYYYYQASPYPYICGHGLAWYRTFALEYRSIHIIEPTLTSLI